MAVSVDGVRSAGELLVLIAAGARPEYLMFWGHRPPRGGGVGRGCLSQWWPADFNVDGFMYRSAEHFMMAEKALLFGDAAAAARIRQPAGPGEAKRLGRVVAGFDDLMWAKRRFEVVVAGNLAKFGQNPALRGFLVATAGKVLVEAAPNDRIWGIGLAAGDDRAASPQLWRGLNLLRFALMEVRGQMAGRKVELVLEGP
jgi:ribA/ribD-fused uncharacterized protein